MEPKTKIMKKQIIFFDGDGTLWYPHATKRTKKPFWLYEDEQLKDRYLEHLILTPQALETLSILREKGMKTVILSTHPDDLEDSALVLDEKVRHFQLSELFDEIYATAEYPEAKGEKILEIIKRLGLSKDDALMVGDSYRWDYSSAQLQGIDAVLINSDYHQEKLEKEPAVIVIDDLNELLPLLGFSELS